MNANTSLISRLFPLSFALPSHLLFFFFIISHLFFSSSVSSRFPFFSIDMSYVMTTHTRRRTNRTSVIIIHASCFWSIYIYIFSRFKLILWIVNSIHTIIIYHVGPIFQTARRGKKAQKKKRKKERMYLSSEQRMPIVCLLYREGFRCNIDLCFKVCTRLRK